MMNLSDLISTHCSLSYEARTLLEQKITNYSGSGDVFTNFKRVEQLGICSVEQGLLARISDKLGRLITHTQTKGGLVGDEGFTDSIHDLINYLVFLYSFIHREYIICQEQQPENVEQPNVGKLT